MLFTEGQRQIFRFWNGQRQVCADPQLCHRRMSKAVGSDDFEALFRTMQAADDGDRTLSPDELDAADRATERILAIARAAFGLASLDDDGNGATEAEQFGALVEFLGFLAKKNETAGNSPTCSEPSPAPSGSEGMATAVPATANPSPTTPGSPSLSTAAA